MLPQPVAQRMGGEQLLGLRKTAPPFIDTEERGQPFLDDREPDILGQGPRISIVSTTDGAPMSSAEGTSGRWNASSRSCLAQRFHVVKMTGHLHIPHGLEPGIKGFAELHANVIALSSH